MPDIIQKYDNILLDSEKTAELPEIVEGIYRQFDPSDPDKLLSFIGYILIKTQELEVDNNLLGLINNSTKSVAVLPKEGIVYKEQFDKALSESAPVSAFLHNLQSNNDKALVRKEFDSVKQLMWANFQRGIKNNSELSSVSNEMKDLYLYLYANHMEAFMHFHGSEDDLRKHNFFDHFPTILVSNAIDLFKALKLEQYIKYLKKGNVAELKKIPFPNSEMAKQFGSIFEIIFQKKALSIDDFSYANGLMIGITANELKSHLSRHNPELSNVFKEKHRHNMFLLSDINKAMVPLQEARLAMNHFNKSDIRMACVKLSRYENFLSRALTRHAKSKKHVNIDPVAGLKSAVSNLIIAINTNEKLPDYLAELAACYEAFKFQTQRLNVSMDLSSLEEIIALQNNLKQMLIGSELSLGSGIYSPEQINFITIKNDILLSLNDFIDNAKNIIKPYKKYDKVVRYVSRPFDVDGNNVFSINKKWLESFVDSADCSDHDKKVFMLQLRQIDRIPTHSIDIDADIEEFHGLVEKCKTNKDERPVVSEQLKEDLQRIAQLLSNIRQYGEKRNMNLKAANVNEPKKRKLMHIAVSLYEKSNAKTFNWDKLSLFSDKDKSKTGSIDSTGFKHALDEIGAFQKYMEFMNDRDFIKKIMLPLLKNGKVEVEKLDKGEKKKFENFAKFNFDIMKQLQEKGLFVGNFSASKNANLNAEIFNFITVFNHGQLGQIVEWLISALFVIAFHDPDFFNKIIGIVDVFQVFTNGVAAINMVNTVAPVAPVDPVNTAAPLDITAFGASTGAIFGGAILADIGLNVVGSVFRYAWFKRINEALNRVNDNILKVNGRLNDLSSHFDFSIKRLEYLKAPNSKCPEIITEDYATDAEVAKTLNAFVQQKMFSKSKELNGTSLFEEFDALFKEKNDRTIKKEVTFNRSADFLQLLSSSKKVEVVKTNLTSSEGDINVTASKAFLTQKVVPFMEKMAKFNRTRENFLKLSSLLEKYHQLEKEMVKNKNQYVLQNQIRRNIECLGSFSDAKDDLDRINPYKNLSNQANEIKIVRFALQDCISKLQSDTGVNCFRGKDVVLSKEAWSGMFSSIDRIHKEVERAGASLIQGKEKMKKLKITINPRIKGDEDRNYRLAFQKQGYYKTYKVNGKATSSKFHSRDLDVKPKLNLKTDGFKDKLKFGTLKIGDGRKKIASSSQSISFGDVDVVYDFDYGIRKAVSMNR